MDIFKALHSRFPKVPKEVLGEVLDAAGNGVRPDFEAYSHALPVIQRVSAAYTLLAKLDQRLVDKRCINCSRKCEVQQHLIALVDEEVSELIRQLNK